MGWTKIIVIFSPTLKFLLLALFFYKNIHEDSQITNYEFTQKLLKLTQFLKTFSVKLNYIDFIFLEILLLIKLSFPSRLQSIAY